MYNSRQRLSAGNIMEIHSTEAFADIHFQYIRDSKVTSGEPDWHGSQLPYTPFFRRARLVFRPFLLFFFVLVFCIVSHEISRGVRLYITTLLEHILFPFLLVGLNARRYLESKNSATRWKPQYFALRLFACFWTNTTSPWLRL